MAWTLCTSGAAIAKAGANANSTITASGGTLLNWSNEAESMACALTGIDVVTQFSGLTANGKEVLQQYTSAVVAQNIINYDVGTYFANEATLILNVLENQKNEAQQRLSNKRFIVDYLGGAV